MRTEIKRFKNSKTKKKRSKMRKKSQNFRCANPFHLLQFIPHDHDLCVASMNWWKRFAIQHFIVVGPQHKTTNYHRTRYQFHFIDSLNFMPGIWVSRKRRRLIEIPACHCGRILKLALSPKTCTLKLYPHTSTYHTRTYIWYGIVIGI